jgi:hypothetical protein
MSNISNRQVVVEDIGKYMQVLKPVYDSTKHKIGEVEQFDSTAGYMQVRRGGLKPELLYIPFHLISGIDPRDIFLSMTEDSLVKDYATSPTAQPVLEQWKNWRSGRTDTMVGHEMRSGYSGQPVMAFRQDYQVLGQQLVAGLSVHDINGENVGKITQFDSRQGWLNVEKGIFGTTVMMIPFSAIREVQTANNTVLLLVPKEALQKDLATLEPFQPGTDAAQRSANS